MFLGFLVNILVHAGIEYPILTIITSDFEHYSQSFVWQNWKLLHGGVGLLLLMLGLVGGFIFGQRYWRIIYIKKQRK